MGYFAQSALELLDPKRTVYEQIDQAFPTATTPSKRTLLAAFDFHSDDLDKPVRVLSGGERSRLVLAEMLFDPPNFLVLDEPTNHLDLATKEILVRTLSKFEGTMLFVSHDRTFLRGLANKVLDLSGGDAGGKRQPLVFHRDYASWVEQTGHEAPGRPPLAGRVQGRVCKVGGTRAPPSGWTWGPKQKGTRMIFRLQSAAALTLLAFAFPTAPATHAQEATPQQRVEAPAEVDAPAGPSAAERRRGERSARKEKRCKRRGSRARRQGRQERGQAREGDGSRSGVRERVKRRIKRRIKRRVQRRRDRRTKRRNS